MIAPPSRVIWQVAAQLRRPCLKIENCGGSFPVKGVYNSSTNSTKIGDVSNMLYYCLVKITLKKKTIAALLMINVLCLPNHVSTPRVRADSLSSRDLYSLLLNIIKIIMWSQTVKQSEPNGRNSSRWGEWNARACRVREHNKTSQTIKKEKQWRKGKKKEKRKWSKTHDHITGFEECNARRSERKGCKMSNILQYLHIHSCQILSPSETGLILVVSAHRLPNITLLTLIATLYK